MTDRRLPLAPGSSIGIVGGGQLGRMLSLAAARLGFQTVILTPEAGSCASQVSARTIVADYTEIAKSLKFKTIQAIPMSARYGDNVTVKSAKMPWYHGPNLLEYLETVQIVEGLQALGHDLWLIRPKQQAQHMAVQTAHFQEVLVKGVPIPFYSELRMGLPAKRELQRLWAKQRPDIVHIATEGPLGWSALQAAKKLNIPVISSYHTNFHQYSKHYKWL